MISGTNLRFCLLALQRGPKTAGDVMLNALKSMLRPPEYEHEVRYPIEKATAEDNWVGPSAEATRWLRENRFHDDIGPYDCTVCNDRYMPRFKLADLDLSAPVPMTDMVVEDRWYVVVSFLCIEDAVLFRLRWCNA